MKPNRMALVCSALPLVGFCVLPIAYAADITWLGGSGTWDDPAQWSGAVVPDSTDTAIINGRTVTADNAVQVDGLVLTGGNLSGSADVTITGNVLPRFSSRLTEETGVGDALEVAGRSRAVLAPILWHRCRLFNTRLRTQGARVPGPQSRPLPPVCRARPDSLATGRAHPTR